MNKIEIPQTQYEEENQDIESNYLKNKIISRHIIIGELWGDIDKLISEKRLSKQIDELEIISAQKNLDHQVRNRSKTKDRYEIDKLEHAGTFCFHFTESWQNIGLIILKLIVQIFQYLFEILKAIIQIIILIIRLIFAIIFNILLIIFFFFYSFIPLRSSENPLEQGRVAQEVIYRLDFYKKKSYILCLELEGVCFKYCTVHDYKKDNTVIQFKVKYLHEQTELLYLKLRPHFEEFLKELSKDFELIVFTKLSENFAEKFLWIFDQNHRVKRAICRKIKQPKDEFIKSIKIFDEKEREKILLIDIINSKIKEEEHVFWIPEYLGDNKDTMLLRLSKYFKRNIPTEENPNFHITLLKNDEKDFLENESPTK